MTLKTGVMAAENSALPSQKYYIFILKICVFYTLFNIIINSILKQNRKQLF